MATTSEAWSGPGGEAGMPGTRIPALPDEVAACCERWHVLEMALFGSVLRDDFGPHSDIDVLVLLGRRGRGSPGGGSVDILAAGPVGDGVIR